MPHTVHAILNLYNPAASLDLPLTIPDPWYRDPPIESHMGT